MNVQGERDGNGGEGNMRKGSFSKRIIRKEGKNYYKERDTQNAFTLNGGEVKFKIRKVWLLLRGDVLEEERCYHKKKS